MAFILQSLESQLSDLLWQISEDYELDYEELSTRYLGCTIPAPERKEPKKKKSAESTSEKKKCCGKTVKGTECKKNALEGSDYCKTHMPASDSSDEGESEGPKLCCGKTSKGQNCKKRAASGSDYCKTHEPKMDELDEEEEEAPEMCKALTGKKQPCKKKAVCDGFCNTHKKGPFKLKEPAHTHEPGEEDSDCPSCSLYGDPVNGSTSELEIVSSPPESPKPVRRSERIRLNALLENIEQEKMDGDETEDEDEAMDDLMSFARNLESELAADDLE